MTEGFLRKSSIVLEQLMNVTQRSCMPIFSSHVWCFAALRMLGIMAVLDSIDLKKTARYF